MSITDLNILATVDAGAGLLPVAKSTPVLERTAGGRVSALDGAPVIRELTIPERAGIRSLFGTNESGAEQLVGRLQAGEAVGLPEGVSADTLRTFRPVAMKQIDIGADRRGTQALRKQAIDILLGPWL